MVTEQSSGANTEVLSILEEVDATVKAKIEDMKKFPERYAPDRWEQVGYFRNHPVHGICGTVFVPMEIMIAGKVAYGWQKGDKEIKELGRIEETHDHKKFMLSLPGNALILWNKEQYEQLCSRKPGCPNSVTVVASVKENTMPVGVRTTVRPEAMTKY